MSMNIFPMPLDFTGRGIYDAAEINFKVTYIYEE